MNPEVMSWGEVAASGGDRKIERRSKIWFRTKTIRKILACIDGECPVYPEVTSSS